MDRLIFNMTEDQIKKLSGEKDDKCDYNTPITCGETFEACIRGSKKIIDDPQKKEMMFRIYRSKNNSNESMERH